MKIVQYKQHSVILEEAGVLFEHDFDKHTNIYFKGNGDNQEILLNRLMAEKVEAFFEQDSFRKLSLYENLYEVCTECGLIYLYDPTGKLLFLRKENDLACSEVSSHSKIYSIFIEKLQQLLGNVTISVHLGNYNPSFEENDEYF